MPASPAPTDDELNQRAEDEATERFSRILSENLRRGVVERRKHNDEQVRNQRTHTAAHLKYRWKDMGLKATRETVAATNAARRKLLRQLGFGSRMDSARQLQQAPASSDADEAGPSLVDAADSDRSHSPPDYDSSDATGGEEVITSEGEPDPVAPVPHPPRKSNQRPLMRSAEPSPAPKSSSTGPVAPESSDEEDHILKLTRRKYFASHDLEPRPPFAPSRQNTISPRPTKIPRIGLSDDSGSSEDEILARCGQRVVKSWFNSVTRVDNSSFTPPRSPAASSSSVAPARSALLESSRGQPPSSPGNKKRNLAMLQGDSSSEGEEIDPSLLWERDLASYLGGKPLSSLDPDQEHEQRPLVPTQPSGTKVHPKPELLDVWATPPVAIPSTLNEILYPHQREGIGHLYQAYKAGKGAILADDMGLGKTVQAIGFLLAIMHRTGRARDDEHRRRRVLEVSDSVADYNMIVRDWPIALVVVPTTLVDNWAKEMNQWGYLEVAIVKDKSSVGEAVEAASRGRIDVLVLNLELVRDAVSRLNDVSWSVVILDEAHRMKSSTSSLAKALHQLNVPVRFALTGTPFLNGYEDLWQQLHWVDPASFASLKAWKIEVSDVLVQGAEANASPLQRSAAQLVARRLRDCLFVEARFLRRTKKLLASVLPPKKDRIVLCPLSRNQKRMYMRVWSEPELQAIIHGDELCCGKTRRNAQGLVEYLKRKDCCDRPFFLAIADQDWDEDDEELPPAMRIRQAMVDAGEDPSLLHVKYCQLGMAKHPMAYQNMFLDIANHLALSFPSPLSQSSILQAPPSERSIGYGLGGSHQRGTHMTEAAKLEKELEQHRAVERHARQLEYVKAIYPQDWAKRIQLGGHELAKREYCGKWSVLQSLLEQWHAEPAWAWAGPQAPGEGKVFLPTPGIARPRPNKVLIFSHRPKILEMIAMWLRVQGWKHMLLDGSTQAKERQGLVDQFNERDEIFVFLISTMAGGVGLNLISANKVVIFDPDWKPAIDAQAMDRAHRTGQTRPVEVYRLIAQGTIEERQYERQMSKTVHAGQVLESDGMVLPTGLFTGLEKEGKQGQLYGWKNLLDWSEDSRAGLILQQAAAVSRVQGPRVVRPGDSSVPLPLALPEGVTVINNFLEHVRVPAPDASNGGEKRPELDEFEEDFEGEEDKTVDLGDMLDEDASSNLCTPAERGVWAVGERERQLDEDVRTYTAYLEAYPAANPVTSRKQKKPKATKASLSFAPVGEARPTGMSAAPRPTPSPPTPSGKRTAYVPPSRRRI